VNLMPEPLAYLNGRLLPASEAMLPLHDAGFVLGATVTDLCRTFRHRLFRLADHLARFRQSCLRAQVPQPLGEDELTRIAEDLVARNAALAPADDDLALVLLATPGPIGYYAGQPGGPGDGPPTLALHTFPLPFARYRPLFETGAHLVIPAVRHVPAACVDPRIKQRSRLHWWLADRQARQIEAGASALLLDINGRLTETAAANFLLVKDGVVRSPPRELVLGGISLLTVQELCAECGIPFAERPLTLDDCRDADEMMLCSTPYCLAGVSRLNGQAVPWPGPVFERLLEAWSARVGMDIRGQILCPITRE
jgi:branched-subunit amino acid aminotransferase/4-amino-4-deoxychorismate lyase